MKRRILEPPPLGSWVDELHRSPTRFERFRGWVEGLPKVRLYFALVLISWVSLTALIVLGERPPLERALAQELMEGATLAQIEQLNLSRSWNSWKVLLGVALAASLMILFTALARFFIELDFNPYLTPLAGLPIIGTMLLGPRLMFLMVVLTSVNVGIMSGNNFLTAALLLVSGFPIYAVVRVDSRQALLKAGLVIAVVMASLTSAAEREPDAAPRRRL